MQPHILNRQREVPFTRPFLAGNEAKYLSQAAGSPASDGRFTKRCAQILRESLLTESVFMTPSCTSALEMAAMLCELSPGDEVILPSFTFTSTANCFVRLGAKPVFVDVRPDTLNLDESKIEAHITPRTRAIFPVHYGGVACEMERLGAIAAEHRLRIVEDAAQGVGGSYKGRALGAIGHLGAFSFHSTKDYTCGEGGALCVNDPELTARAEVIRDKGTNRGRFIRGEIDKYTWVDVGSSYVPSELACAYLCGQLEAMHRIRGVKRQIFEQYVLALAPLQHAGLLSLPDIPPDCAPSYHMFYVLCRDSGTRDRLLEHCLRSNIGACFHYVPLHCSPMGVRFGYRPGDLPVTEDVSSRLLRLPFYAGLRDEDQAAVVACLEKFFGGGRGNRSGPALPSQ